jgi:hypothetical protein
MTEVLMKTRKGANFCNQAASNVERRTPFGSEKKMRNAHISEMRSNVFQFPTVEECDFDQQFLFDEYVAIYHRYVLKRYHRKAK